MQLKTLFCDSKQVRRIVDSDFDFAKVIAGRVGQFKKFGCVLSRTDLDDFNFGAF